MEEPIFIIKGERVIEIIFEGIRIPCNAPDEKRSEIIELLKRLRELGVFTKGTTSYDDFVASLTDKEREILKSLPVDEWLSKEDLDKIIGTKEREIAGVLANLTRKAREHQIIDRDGSLIEKKLDKGQLYYRLPRKFMAIKKMVSGGNQ